MARGDLDMETPASVLQFSKRPFPERIAPFDYNSEFKILKVTQNGAVRRKTHHWVYLTVALKGRYRRFRQWNLESIL
jgi:hypothetical protein